MARVSPSLARSPALGTELAGRYRLLERIGIGGSGEVFRAADESLQRTVAIKFVRPGGTPDLAQASRLIEGAWAASQIRHPNIVQVHETGLSEYGPFIVMEDLRGENVGRLLDRHGRLKKEYCFAIIEPVLLALSQAHSIGLLHGDVKPENIMVCQGQGQDQRVTVKLLDFGARTVARNTEALMGVVDYLSPEQVSAGPIDHRSDLFSVCVVLYELLTNSLPFHGTTTAATATRIATFDPPSLTRVGLPGAEELSRVVARGLSKSSIHRYPNARELLESLRPLMKGEASSGFLLSELLPQTTFIRHVSGTMPAQRGSQGPWNRGASSIPGPESGSRILGAALHSSAWPTASRPAPVTSSPVTSSPVTSSPAPITSSPAPITSSPAPITSSPAPITSSPIHAPSSLAASAGRLAPVLPARYRGRFHARAIVWQALDEYVRTRRPAELREQILYEIGDVVASDLLLGTLYGFTHCDLESLTHYIELVTTRLFDSDPSWCRVAGNDTVDGILSPALSRSIPPNSSIAATLRRVARVVGPFFDFGHWQIEQDDLPHHATLSITDLDVACQGLRLWFVGLIERSMSMTRQRTTVTIARGESSFMSRLTIEVNAD